MSKAHQPMDAADIAVIRRTTALFKSMSADFLLREQFVTDPSQVLYEYVCNARLDPEKASASNRLIFSVMSSMPLLRWLRHYVRHHRSNPPSRQRLLKDFASALVQHQADHVVFTLLRGGAEAPAPFDISGILQAVLRSGVFVADDDGGGETDFGPTNSTSDHTDVQTDIPTDITLTNVTVTDITDPFTGATFFTDVTNITHITDPTDSTDVTQITDPTDVTQSTHITHVTEITHITGAAPTHVGPTTPVTHMTEITDITELAPEGHSLAAGFFGAAFWDVSLVALARYANQLLRSGALDIVEQ
jgi:hypothetical protein